MPLFPFAEAFTILSESVTGTDSYGNDVLTPTEIPTTGAFAPLGSTELIQGQTTVIDHDTVYLTDGAPVPKPTDRVRREATSVVYLIDGTPAVYANPWTAESPGAVLRLLEVTG